MAVMLPSSNQPRDEFWKTTQRRAAQMAASMNRHGVHIGIEFLGPEYLRFRLPYAFIWKMSDTLQWCKEAGANWGFILDSWHWHWAGATTDDILAAGRSRIAYVHLSDARRMRPEDVRDNMRLFPGEGVIDFNGFFRALERIGYDSGVSPEPLGRVPASMSPQEASAIALKTTRAVMEKAGVTIIDGRKSSLKAS
jgi:sugar phosphate isomerase/epimerase